MEALRIPAVLEADDEVVRIAHDDEIAPGVALPPLIDPQVERIMQIHVGQQGRDDRPPGVCLPHLAAIGLPP
jgi:hypothetical protein